jgi:hypothetical protein
MLAAIAEDRPVGGALAFRNDDNSAVPRIIAVVEGFRHRGIGRRLVERFESEARLLGMEAVGLGTDEAVGFWFHLGYTPNLLFQWVYEPEEYERESEALLTAPCGGCTTGAHRSTTLHSSSSSSMNPASTSLQHSAMPSRVATWRS